MKHILIFLITFFSIVQVKASVTLLPDTSKTYSVKIAKSDIRNGNIKFLLMGGIVSTYRKGQEIFEKKYKVKYSDLGCVMPTNLSVNDYNKTVALYMDKKFGLGWRIDVRPDVKGI